MLKKIALAVLLTCGWAGAQATENTPPSAGFAPFVGFCLTYGGGLVAMLPGIEYQTMNSPLFMQLSIGYHVDDTLIAKNGSGYVADQNYTASTGLVLEAEMFFSPTVSMKMRAVSEKYTPETGVKQELDGSHLGVIGVYYFK